MFVDLGAIWQMSAARQQRVEKAFCRGSRLTMENPMYRGVSAGSRKLFSRMIFPGAT
jgi:hypothetical protein